MLTKPVLLAILTMVILSAAAWGQANNSSVWQTPGNIVVPGQVVMCINGSTLAVSCSTTTPLPVNQTATAAGTAGAGYPSGATPITGNSTGTTGAVVGTLAGAAAKFTYICGFNVSTIGGTAASSPITVAGLVGSSQVYQTPVNSTNGQIIVTQTFTPCIPSSAVNTAITITTTAALGASAVDVNSWGFQQ